MEAGRLARPDGRDARPPSLTRSLSPGLLFISGHFDSAAAQLSPEFLRSQALFYLKSAFCAHSKWTVGCTSLLHGKPTNFRRVSGRERTNRSRAGGRRSAARLGRIGVIAQ